MKNIVSLICLFTAFSFPQQFTNWSNYSDMKQVQSVFASQNTFYAASSGGGFSYNFSESIYQKFNKADGLTGIELTSVTEDRYGKIWFGSSTGVIDIVNPDNGAVKSLLDIANSDRVNKNINFLFSEGDTVYAATDFGISLINAGSLVFVDTYFKFGTFSSNIKVKSITKHQGLIYAATESGIAVQKQGAVNLSAPESWDVFPELTPGLSSNANKIVFWDDAITVATEKGISIFSESGWQSLITNLNNTAVLDLVVIDDTLFIMTANSILSFNSGNLTTLFNSQVKLNSFGYSESNGLLAASSAGVKLLSEEIFYVPDGPAANQFPDMTVDSESNFWSASGKDGAGKGVYLFDGQSWGLYNRENYPEINNNDFVSIYSAPDNTIYAGNWGQGFIRIKGDNITRFSVHNTDMVGIPLDPNFLLVTGFGVDSRNNLWVLNGWPADRNVLAMLTPDSTWHYFNVPSAQNRILAFNSNLVVDQYDTKWFSSDDEGRKGLFYFNEVKTYENSEDDFSGYLNFQAGLNSNVVNSVVIDRRGDVWVGTGLGINIISNTGTVLSSNPQLRISSVFSVRQQSINDIAVDPLNQKWVATNQGLVLLNSDGSRLLAALDTKNSPLLSDIIESIAIDEVSGKIYVGTEAGLTVFETPAIRPLESFDELFSFPNPLIITDGSQFLTIDGLIRDCDIKILSVSGKLVSEFSSPGGRVGYWDGKDENGDIVNSGIYIIVAYDKDGNSVATGKVAVLRK
ncbi:MAG: two-component regulator propeller domain-containing protein [Ignavibacteriaceae bacterium]